MTNNLKRWNLLPYQIPCYNSWKINKDDCAYNVLVGIDVLGDLDVNVFYQAIEVLVKEHYVFSNFKFFEHDDKIKQEYAGEDLIDFEQHYVATEEEIESLTSSLIKIPFNLSKPPLVKNILIQKKGKNRYRYVMLTHHIIADPVTGQRCIDLIAKIYKAISSGGNLPSPTKNKAMNYLDDFKSINSNQHKLDAYLQEYVVKNMHFNFGKHSDNQELCSTMFMIDQDTSALIKKYLNSTNTSAFNLFSSAFAILMHIVHNTSELMITYPVNTRVKQNNDTLGPFLNLNFFSSKIEELTTIAHLQSCLEKQHIKMKEFNNDYILTNLDYLFRGYGVSMLERPNLCIIETLALDTDFNIGNNIRSHKINYDILGYYYDLALSYELSDLIKICWSYKKDLLAPINIKTYQQYLIKILRTIVSEPDILIKNIGFTNIKLRQENSFPGVDLLNNSIYKCNKVLFSSESKKTNISELFSGAQEIEWQDNNILKNENLVCVLHAKEIHSVLDLLSKTKTNLVLVLLSYVDEVYELFLPHYIKCIKVLLDYNDNHFAILKNNELLPTTSVQIERSELELAGELLVNGRASGINATLKSDYKLYLYINNIQLDYQRLAINILTNIKTNFVYLDLLRKIYLVNIEISVKDKITTIYGIDDLQYKLNEKLLDIGLGSYIPLAWINIYGVKNKYQIITKFSENLLSQSNLDFNDKFVIKLKEIWADCALYNADNIVINEKYSYYGIDSLESVNLLSKINDTLGTNFPISWLVKNDTIAMQSRDIANKREDVSDLYEPIVRFNKGEIGYTPLVFIHSMFYHSSCYESLAAHIDSRVPIYAINSYNLDSNKDFIESIPDLAKLYVEYILSHIHSEKFYISGWCHGGILALEIARQLVALDYKVEKLILLDSAKLQKSLASLIGRYVRTDMLKRYLPMKTAAFIESLPSSYQKHLFKVMRLEFIMQSRYNFPKYYGETLFLRAKDKGIFGKLHKLHYSSPLNGLDACLQNCKIIDIPGDHNAMISDSSYLTARALNSELIEFSEQHEEVVD